MASIQKKNNKYCVVYYCKDTDGNRSGKRMIQRTQLKSEKQKLN